MRNTCKICWIVLAIFLIGNIVLLGVWWFENEKDSEYRGERYKKEDYRNKMRKHLFDNAGIEGEQFERMYDLWKSHSKVMHQHQSEADSLRKRLMNETFRNNSDSLNVELLFDQLANKQRAIEKANYYHFRKLRDICENDKQRDMLDKMFRSRIMHDGPKKRFRGHRNKH